MKISALATGSSGNCFYIENEKKNAKNALLIDCGISCKQIEKRLSEIKRNPENIKAVFVTHEHSDHIKGVDVFARKFKVPVFAPKKMVQECFLCKDKELLNGIKNNETTKIAGLEITAFPKSHKSLDPISYNIIESNKKLAVMTDAGYACRNIIENVSDSNFIAIESNYDEKMLEEGSYPWPTKQWIKSDLGHLSNTQSALCVLEHSHKKLKNLMLCHISENNNTYEKALKAHEYALNQKKGDDVRITVSTRESPTSILKV